MSCGWVTSIVPGGCQVSEAAGGAASSLVNSISAELASVMKSLMTFWIKAPDPDLASGPGSVIAQVQNITTPIIVFSVIVGIIVAGMKMVRASADTQGDLEGLTRGLLLIVAVSVAGAGVVALLESGFSQLAQYVLDKGFNGHDVGQTLLKLFSDPSGGGGAATVIFGVLGIIVSAIQWAIMIFRGAILALLVGILPVAAAGALTDGGMASFKKVCGWISAFILYRAAAAIIYATAFLMLGSGTSSGILFGMTLVVLSILALPALLRLMPAGAAAMGGGGGSALGAVVGAVATGSMLLAGRGASGGAAVAASPTGSQTPGLKETAGHGGGPGGSGSPGDRGSSSGSGAGGSAGSPSGGSTTGGQGGRPMLVGVGGSHSAGGAAGSGGTPASAPGSEAGGAPGGGSAAASTPGGATSAAAGASPSPTQNGNGGSGTTAAGGTSGGGRVQNAMRAAQVGQAVKRAGDAVGDAATGSETGSNA